MKMIVHSITTSAQMPRNGHSAASLSVHISTISTRNCKQPQCTVAR